VQLHALVFLFDVTFQSEKYIVTNKLILKRLIPFFNSNCLKSFVNGVKITFVRRYNIFIIIFSFKYLKFIY